LKPPPDIKKPTKSRFVNLNDETVTACFSGKDHRGMLYNPGGPQKKALGLGFQSNNVLLNGFAVGLQSKLVAHFFLYNRVLVFNLTE
jgi:hypothetical protein